MLYTNVKGQPPELPHVDQVNGASWYAVRLRGCLMYNDVSICLLCLSRDFSRMRPAITSTGWLGQRQFLEYGSD